ncbi:hypothetical protein H0H87_011260, partial [Tephrocybe sp. NHM501043]
MPILYIRKGMVLSGSGQAEFLTRDRAIVFKPFKGGVVHGLVGDANKVRGWAGWDRERRLMKEYIDADVGSLTVFVSHQ